MSDLITAAESIRRLAVQYQGMIQAADALEAMGQIEQTTAEAKKAQADAIAGRDAVLAELAQDKADADAAVQKAQADAVAIAQEAEDRRSAIVESAAQSASAMLDQARAQADQIKVEAQANADALTSTLQAQIANLAAQKDSLTGDVAAQQCVLDQAHAELAAAETKLAAIKAAIAQATSL